MKPPLHCRDIFSFQSAEHQLSLVSRSCGDGKTGDLMIRNNHRFPHFIAYVSQSASQHQCDFWPEGTDLLLNEFGTLHIFLNGRHDEPSL